MLQNLENNFVDDVIIARRRLDDDVPENIRLGGEGDADEKYSSDAILRTRTFPKNLDGDDRPSSNSCCAHLRARRATIRHRLLCLLLPFFASTVLTAVAAPPHPKGAALSKAAPASPFAPRLRKSDVCVRGGTATATLSISAGGKRGVNVDTNVDAKLQRRRGTVTLTPCRSTNLLSVRLVFLTFYASLGSLLPFLPVYYHSLGLSGETIGILGAVNPATTFFVAPLWGALADSTGRGKDILIFTFVTSVMARLCIALRNDVKWLIFWVFTTALLNAPVKPLLDSAVMNIIPDKSQYGKLRLWGQFGFAIGSTLVGISLNRASEMAFKSAFVIHAAITFPTLLCMRSFRDDNDDGKDAPTTREGRVGADFRQGLRFLLRSPDALIFFGLVFVLGVSSGIIENFAYVRMREVGGVGKDMGISRLISSAAGVPMFWFSGELANAMGVDRILVLSLVSYAVRFFIYASMKRPMAGLPAEALRGITFGAFWSSATIYAHRISPPGMSATFLSLLNAMYGGIGQSFGAVIGGKLQSWYGTVNTFMYAGIGDLIFIALMIVYLALRDTSFHAPKQIDMSIDMERDKKGLEHAGKS